MKQKNRIYKLVLAALVTVSVLFISGCMVHAKNDREPSITPVTGEDVFIGLYLTGKFMPIGDYMYVSRRISMWESDCSDDRLDGTNYVTVYALFDQHMVPLYMYGTGVIKQDGKIRWWGSWTTAYHEDGNSIIKYNGIGLGPYRGLKLMCTYTTPPEPTDGSPWIETMTGFIIDPYGR